MKKRIVVAILILLIPILLLVAEDVYLKNRTTYTEGTVISVNPEENDITVSVGEGGPRIFIEDLGGYSLEDISYGDTVEMSFTNGFYYITKVRKEVDD